MGVCNIIYNIRIIHSYITKARTCFVASAPSSGSLYNKFAEVIEY